MHQVPLWNYMMGGGKRAVSVWHRRAGKDSTALNFTAASMFARKGVYWHMLPTVVQGRKVIWNGIDYRGNRIIEQVFPDEIRKRTNNNEMLIETINGSMWQVCGSDNFNSLVGSNPLGVIFSEWSIADPSAWDYIRPILLENGGWAIFIYTARGKNHGYKTYKMAQENDKWFSELLTVNDTCREDGAPIMTEDMIQEEKDAGMPPDMIQQEYYCSFEAGMAGAFYTYELKLSEDEGRQGDYPWDPAKPCFAVWDLGIQDATSIGIFQTHPQNGNPVLIDAINDRNKGLDHYIRVLGELPYVILRHFAPHDIEVRDWATGKSRKAIAATLGIDFEVTDKLLISDGIQACRNFLRICYFNTHKEGVTKVIDSLSSYRREFDDKRDMYTDRPVHDWASHDSDMMRYAGVDWHPNILDTDPVTNIKVKRAHR